MGQQGGMHSQVQTLTSILSADFAHLAEEIARIADEFHKKRDLVGLSFGADTFNESMFDIIDRLSSNG